METGLQRQREGRPALAAIEGGRVMMTGARASNVGRGRLWRMDPRGDGAGDRKELPMANPRTGKPGTIVPPAKAMEAWDADEADPGQVEQIKKRSGRRAPGSTAHRW